MKNYKKKIYNQVVEDFGNEWNEFNQSELKTHELNKNFSQSSKNLPRSSINFKFIKNKFGNCFYL